MSEEDGKVLSKETIKKLLKSDFRFLFYNFVLVDFMQGLGLLLFLPASFVRVATKELVAMWFNYFLTELLLLGLEGIKILKHQLLPPPLILPHKLLHRHCTLPALNLHLIPRLPPVLLEFNSQSSVFVLTFKDLRIYKFIELMPIALHACISHNTSLMIDMLAVKKSRFFLSYFLATFVAYF